MNFAQKGELPIVTLSSPGPFLGQLIFIAKLVDFLYCLCPEQPAQSGAGKDSPRPKVGDADVVGDAANVDEHVAGGTLHVKTSLT